MQIYTWKRTNEHLHNILVPMLTGELYGKLNRVYVNIGHRKRNYIYLFVCFDII